MHTKKFEPLKKMRQNEYIWNNILPSDANEVLLFSCLRWAIQGYHVLIVVVLQSYGLKCEFDKCLRWAIQGHHVLVVVLQSYGLKCEFDKCLRWAIQGHHVLIVVVLQSYGLKCELDAGTYRVLPYTTGCRFKQRAEDATANMKEAKLVKTVNDKIAITSKFRWDKYLTYVSFIFLSLNLLMECFGLPLFLLPWGYFYSIRP